jgi:hypothetical protein
LYPFSGNAAAMNIDLSAPGLSGVEEVPSGYYRIRLLIGGTIGGVSKTAAKTAVLHISNSLMTTALYTLGPDDFTDAELHIVENSTELGNALNSISAASGTVFTILIKRNFSSPPVSLTNTGYSGKTITLRGDSVGVVNEISLAGQGSLFTIGSAASDPVLILQNITLKGVTENNAALVKVDNGTLIMEDGSVITGNTNFSYYGGGVYVAENGSLAMQGNASVNGNTAYSNSYSSYSYGGGIYINNQATLTKTGGVIYGSNETGTGSDGYALKNTAGNAGAAVYAVYYNGSLAKYRETTVGLNQNLSTYSNTNWSD